MGLIPCGNPDAHLYWDDFHPTARAHSIIGSEFAAAVPEPEIGAMLAVESAFSLSYAPFHGGARRDEEMGKSRSV